MRRSWLILLLAFSTSPGFCDETLTLIPPAIESLNQLNLSLVQNFATDSRASQANLDTELLANLLSDDPFKVVPSLRTAFPTPLSQKVFRRVPEFKALQDKVSALRAQILEHGVTYQFDSNTLSNYDIEASRFTVSLGTNWVSESMVALIGLARVQSLLAGPKVWNAFNVSRFSGSLRSVPNKDTKELQTRVLPIECRDEGIALQVESAAAAGNLTVTLRVIPDGRTVKDKVSFYLMPADESAWSGQAADLKTQNLTTTTLELASLEVIVSATDTGQVLLRRAYP